jgi:hypothetical protein
MTLRLCRILTACIAIAGIAGCGGDGTSIGVDTNVTQDTPADIATDSDPGTEADATRDADAGTETGTDPGTDPGMETGTDTEPDADVGADCPDGCLIDSVCHPDGTANPGNACTVCTRTLSATAWTDNDGAACDDDLFCTGADTCGAGTCSVHGGNGCVDDVACNGVESCDEAGKTCVAGQTTCDDDYVCDTATDTCRTTCTGCLILEICHADGVPNPENACEWCAAATLSTGWSSHDAQVCGSHGACQSGVCECEPGYTGATCDTCIQFVNAAAVDDTGDGASWATARKTVQPAIDAASPLGCNVWVAAGTYLPTTGTDRNASIVLADGVAVYGGFLGTETRLTQRDRVANVTTFSGDIGVVDDPADNSLHVVRGATGATLDGFTIVKGMASGSFLDDTSAGGGMLNVGASPTVAHCTFTGNYAILRGGGMSNLGGSAPTVTDCLFVDNSAGYGGGMHCDASSAIVTRCIFKTNTAAGRSNSQGGGMDNENGSNSIVTDCDFIGNYAPFSSAMNIYASSPTLTNCLFLGNWGGESNAGWGGGMVIMGGSPTLTNCVFAQNSSHAGGGVYVYTGSNPTFNNCTFWNNYADPGYGEGLACRSAVTINNSIFWDDTFYQYQCTPVVNNSDLCGMEGTNGNICSDPLFASVVSTDANFLRLGADSPCIDQAGADATVTDRLGNAAFDVDTVVNASASARDMGAYEYRP